MEVTFSLSRKGSASSVPRAVTVAPPTLAGTVTAAAEPRYLVISAVLSEYRVYSKSPSILPVATTVVLGGVVSMFIRMMRATTRRTMAPRIHIQGRMRFKGFAFMGIPFRFADMQGFLYKLRGTPPKKAAPERGTALYRNAAEKSYLLGGKGGMAQRILVHYAYLLSSGIFSIP